MTGSDLLANKEWAWVVAVASTWVLIAAPILLVWLVSYRKTKYNLPPGPPAWPLIGNMTLLMDPSKPPHHVANDMAKIYGPIFLLKVGMLNFVFVTDPEITMEFLKANDHLFAYRPPGLLAAQYLLYGNRNISLGNQGEHHSFHRKLVVTELLTAKKLQSFQALRTAEQDTVFREMFNAALRHETVNVHNHLSSMSLNVISQLAFSRKFYGLGARSKADKEWTHIIPEMTECFGLLLAESCHASLRWLDTLTGNRKRMQVCFRKMDGLLQEILNDHTKELDALSPKELAKYDAKDFMDIVLLHRHGEHANFITDNDVKAVSLDLIVAGSESVTTATEWALSELLINPHVMKRAQEEVDSVVGKQRSVTEADTVNMPYVAAVIKEAFRMHEPLPWLLPHSNRVPCKVGGYDIPVGSFVNFNVYGMARSPLLWENPLKFDPNRFLSGDSKFVDMKGSDAKLLPFGAGRRICPGMTFAHIVVHTVLARLIHTFDWSIADGQTADSVDMTERAGAVASKKVPLRAVPTPRLASTVYESLQNDI